ncbi:MAG: inositol monophosphatase family protein [Pseudomonadota bacterium]
MEQVKRIGVRAAVKAGEVLRSFHGGPLNVRKKGAIDLVTEADMASEKVIIEMLRSVFPSHSVLAEESGRSIGDDQCQWIIDPLDGTTNFAHGLGLYAVSIAFALAGEVVLGLVLAPNSGELFAAVKGEGATLNGKAIGVSRVKGLSDSLLVTGFPYNVNERIASLIARFSRCILASQGVRRLGSAALDLCFVACGRFEGFWEENLKPWDTAAGALIAREAGGEVTDFSGAPFSRDMLEIAATNGLVHQELLTLLAQG